LIDRLGIDVGGTNTGAVILDCSDQVRAKVKVPTTAYVTSGVIAALDAVVRSLGIDASRITHAMLGTTHAINAVLERRKLLRVGRGGVLRDDRKTTYSSVLVRP